ncbi:RNA ligase family protein, partial [Streptomyces phytophilus]|uniref:RNA ligase family protein n=1 Tax=Streptomyces phytophilus TaxID=722715 RepID=UPI0015F04B7B
MRVHYPRTPHLPWSPGAASDDIRAGELSGLRGREVVVTEKLDGENTTLYADGLHARSLDSAHHPSRAWVKGLQGRIGGEIPRGRRVCGENVFARHSIAYEDLESRFYGFSVWDGDRCLDWDRSVRFLRRLGVPVPPVLWRGVFDERVLRGLRLDTLRQEGYVVRTVEGFGLAEFGKRVAKWVRRGHVQTGTHWMHTAVVENGLGPKAALWAVRSGGAADAASLSAALGIAPADPSAAEAAV